MIHLSMFDDGEERQQCLHASSMKPDQNVISNYFVVHQSLVETIVSLSEILCKDLGTFSTMLWNIIYIEILLTGKIQTVWLIFIYRSSVK